MKKRKYICTPQYGGFMGKNKDKKNPEQTNQSMQSKATNQAQNNTSESLENQKENKKKNNQTK